MSADGTLLPGRDDGGLEPSLEPSSAAGGTAPSTPVPSTERLAALEALCEPRRRRPAPNGLPTGPGRRGGVAGFGSSGRVPASGILPEERCERESRND